MTVSVIISSVVVYVIVEVIVVMTVSPRVASYVQAKRALVSQQKPKSKATTDL